jgi:hypothetical protein
MMFDSNGDSGTPLRSAFPRRTDQAILQDPRVQECADEFQHACISNALGQPTHQEVVIHSGEKLSEVEVHDPPIAARQMVLCGRYRLMRRPPRPKAVAVVREGRVEDGLQHVQHRLLDKSVENRGDANFRTPPSGFRISTRLTGDGVYVPRNNSSRCCGQCARR